LSKRRVLLAISLTSVDEYTTRVYDLSTKKIKKLTIMGLDYLSTPELEQIILVHNIL